MVEDEVDPVKSLYRQLIRSKNPEVSGKFKKYGYNQFKEKLTTDQEAKDDLANYLVDKGEVKSQDDFYGMVDVRAPKATVAEPEEKPTKVFLPVPRPEATQNPAMDALDPTLTQHAPSPVQEKAGIIQTFKDTWGGTRQIVEPLIQHGKDIAKGIQRGWAQGEAIQKAPLTDLATGSEKVDFKGIADANRKVKDMGQTGAEADFATSTGAMDDITDYAKMVLPVVSESIATLIRSGAEEAGVGAAAGAGLGSVVPGIGTVAGAGTGAAAGMAQAGYNMELYASIMDGLEEKGIDTGDEAQLKAAFADKSLMEPILSKANKRAAIIAGVDLVGGAAANSAGRALRAVEHVSPLGKILSRTAKIAGKADDALTGGTGEAAAQLATEGKINPQEVALETLGEAPIAGAIREGLNVNGSSFFKKKTAQAEAAQLTLPAGPDSPEQNLIDGTKPEPQRLPAGPETPRQIGTTIPKLLPPAPPSAIEGARDAVVDQIQSRGSVDIEQFNPLNAVPETVVHTTDRLDNDIPVDPIQIKEAMDWFYDVRKQVLDMRNDPNRMLTIGQINGIVDDIDATLYYIGDAKANLENSEGATVLPVESTTQQEPQETEGSVVIEDQDVVVGDPAETETAETPLAPTPENPVVASNEQSQTTPLPQQTNAERAVSTPETEPAGTDGLSTEVVAQEPIVDSEGVEGVGEPIVRENDVPLTKEVGKEAPKSNTDKAIDYLQSLLDETDNAAGLNAEFYRIAIKGMIAAIKAGKTVANAISEAIDYLVGKGENRDEVVAALEKHRKPLEALVPTAESGPDKVEKKVLNRAFRGTTDADVKKAIEKLGLYRTPESQDQALERGRQLVEELGVEGALQAARTNANNMNGMTVAAIYGAAIEDVYLRSQEAETAEEHIALVNQQAAIVAEASGEGTWAGQFIGMLPKIYESGEVPYDYEAKVKEYKTEFGSISPEVEARMKAADEALQEANKKIFELNKKLREQEAAEAPGNIKEAIERENKAAISKKYGATNKFISREQFEKDAAVLRKMLSGKSGQLFSAGIPAELVRVAAFHIEAGARSFAAFSKKMVGQFGDGIKPYLDDAYKAGQEDLKSAAIKSEGAEMVNGDIKVPHSLMRYYVEQGMTDIDEIAKAIKDDLNDDNLTIRDIRDAITGYGKKVNRTKPQITQDITDLKRIGKKLSLLEDLQKGIKKEKNEAKKRVLSDREAQLQKELDAFSVKKFGEKTPMDKYKERTQKQIDELNRKVSEKDFSTKTRTPQTEFDEAALKLYGEREAAKDKYDYEFEKARLEQRTTDQKRGDALLDVIGLTKSLKASFDMSAPLRQGLVILGSQSPIKSAKDLKFMFQSVADIYRGKKDKEDHYHKWLAELKGSKDWPLMKEAGLFIAQEDPRMIAREEAFATNLLREIPILEKDYKGVKGLKLATASEIAYNAFLNHQRVQAFREGVEALKDAGKSFESDPTEYKSLANYINVATGRADLKNVGPKAMKWLNVGFFSPRFMAARLQSLNPTKYYFMPPTARKLALIRDAKFLATVATLVGLMAIRLKGDDDDETDIELNPKSPDFLKVKLGDTKIDAFGGYGGYFSMLAQVASGERKNRKTGEVEVLGKKYGSPDETDVAKDFLLGKLAPVPGAFLNFKLAQENEDGQLVNRFGEDVTVKNTIIDLTAPLYLSDAKEIWSNHKVPTATALSVMAFFGGGVNTAQKRALTNAQSVAKALNPGDKEQSESKKLLKSAIESGDNESIQKQFKAYRADKTPYAAAKEIWKELAQDKLNDKYGVETKYADNLLRFLFKNKLDERIKVGKEMKYVRDVISQEQADGLRVAYKEQLEKRRAAEKILSQLGGQDFSKKHLKGDWSRYVK